jgi:hypothetical protein
MWRDELAATIERERSLLGRAFADKPVTILSVPRVGRPATFIDGTARVLGIEP